MDQRNEIYLERFFMAGRDTVLVSYSKSEVPNVIEYIRNQDEHHRKKTFIEEYQNLLAEFEIDYDERFMFKPVDYDMLDSGF